MPEVFVGIGSNVEPEDALRLAVNALERQFGEVRTAGVYRSGDARGAGGAYLNTAAAFVTAAPLAEVAATLAAVERLVGRERTNAALCRLDLDLLLYGRRVEAERRLPRPGILTEPFVLAPLAELGPTVAHPLSGETLAAAWCAMPAGEVSRVVRLGRLVSL